MAPATRSAFAEWARAHPAPDAQTQASGAAPNDYWLNLTVHAAAPLCGVEPARLREWAELLGLGELNENQSHWGSAPSSAAASRVPCLDSRSNSITHFALFSVGSTSSRRRMHSRPSSRSRRATQRPAIHCARPEEHPLVNAAQRSRLPYLDGRRRGISRAKPASQLFVHLGLRGEDKVTEREPLLAQDFAKKERRPAINLRSRLHDRPTPTGAPPKERNGDEPEARG